MLRRAALVVLAVLALAYAGAGAVSADEPATLGGTLGASREVVIIQSAATVPVRVDIAAPEGWRFAEASFPMNPGDRRTVDVVTAGADGQITARMVAVDVPEGTDRAALVLSLGTPRPDVPLPLWPVLVGILAAALAALGLLRWRRWQRERLYMPTYHVQARLGR